MFLPPSFRRGWTLLATLLAGAIMLNLAGCSSKTNAAAVSAGASREALAAAVAATPASTPSSASVPTPALPPAMQAPVQVAQAPGKAAEKSDLNNDKAAPAASAASAAPAAQNAATSTSVMAMSDAKASHLFGALVTGTTESATLTTAEFKPLVGKKFSHGLKSEKKIALTFDDGPNPKLTPIVVEALKKEGIPATFFWIGEMVRDHPATAKLVVDAGFEVGNHSFTHPNLTKKDLDGIHKELEDTQAMIEKTTGRKPVLFRPPGGSVDARVAQVAAANGLVMILWSVDTDDWKPGATPDSIVAHITKELTGGGIILVHDIHGQTVATLPRIIEAIKAKGYTFTSVGELVKDQAESPEPVGGGDVKGGSPGKDDEPAKPVTIPLDASGVR